MFAASGETAREASPWDDPLVGEEFMASGRDRRRALSRRGRHRVRAGGGAVTIRLGSVVFDDVVYDERADVLYLSVGRPRKGARLEATPQGHHVRYGDDGDVIGLTIVNARWLLDRGERIEVPLRVRRRGTRRCARRLKEPYTPSAAVIAAVTSPGSVRSGIGTM